MRKIRAKQRVYVDKELTHCGHEPACYQAHEEGERLMAFIEESIEELAQKAGVP